MQDSMRRVLIDRLLSDKSVVTLQELQDVLKVSIPTIKRDLRYMRKELKAPIVYSRTRGGYLYDLPAGKSGASPEFQRFWFSAQELYVVVKMVDMLKALSKDKSSVILQDLEPLRSRVAGLLNLGGKSPREILGRVKVIDPSVIHGEPETFLTIGSALFEHKRVQISYYSRTRRAESFREISAQRLVHYRNYWYVDAFCHATNALRTFAIDNIRRVIVLGTTAKRVPLHTIGYNLDQSYGLFMSGDPKLAVLRFDAEASPYLKRETWHPRQTLEEHGDEVVLTVPYTNPTELIGDIFRWREHVVVEAPEELRREVRECLLKTLSQY